MREEPHALSRSGPPIERRERSRAAAHSGTETVRNERRFRIRYQVEIPAHDAPLRVWLPVPRSDEFQTVTCLELALPETASRSIEGVHGNESLYVAPGRSANATMVHASYDVLRRERVAVPVLTPSPSAADLGADARVPVTGHVVEDAVARLQPNDPPRTRAEKVFRYVVDTFDYDGRGCTFERSPGLGDLEQACDLRSGTCTELHGIFVACSRAAGIPAKFVFGFNVPHGTSGPISGYHCWTEVFLPETGWTPVDVSEARKRDPGPDREFYFGNLDPNRVQFTVGRDVVLSPPQEGAPLDRFIFPYAESAGSPFVVTPAISFDASTLLSR